MFELYQLRYFLAVVETGNFTKAAARVFVTQPTLSAGIKKLESHLDTQLFHRSSKRVFLTDAGTRFLKRAKSIMYECNQATQELKHVEEKQVLRLGTLRTIPGALVSNLLGDFRRARGGAVIELFEGTEQEMINRLDEGSIDMAMTILRGGEQQGAVTTLFEEGYCLAIADDHPLASHDRISGEQLANDNMVVRTRCEVLSETSRYFTDRNVRPRLVYRTELDERALDMVAAGLGATVMPQSYARQGVSKITLVGFNFRRVIGLVASQYSLPDSNNGFVNQFAAFAVSQRW
jgi:DNA-binding transcriptional LysR family regulator